MLYDTSIKDKEIKREIIGHVGAPYNFVDMFFRQVGTVGSSRMEIISHSILFNKVMSRSRQSVYASIELRPHGIIVILNIRLSNYSWVIPFHHLSIFKTDILVIHGQGQFLKLKISGDQNKSIVCKILRLKNKIGNNEYYG
jgi:hypothetical protein